MRTALAISLLAVVAVIGCTPPAIRHPGPRLRVGDPAPPLQVTRWLNGEPVARLEPGTPYVLEFWATWCGPCLEAMPHLAELAKRHEAAGLVVIPVTTVGGRNPRAAVESYVAANGPRFGFRYAVCEDRRMQSDWYEAAGQEGIPCTFVVDRRGKIAFIGHPMEAERAIDIVVAGAGPNN